MAETTALKARGQRLSLARSLRHYGVWLLGVALFPPSMFLGVEILGVPSEVFVVPLLIVVVPLQGALVRGRVPYTLWIVAMGIWAASICVTALLTA
jgi:hypothetical protein